MTRHRWIRTLVEELAATVEAAAPTERSWPDHAYRIRTAFEQANRDLPAGSLRIVPIEWSPEAIHSGAIVIEGEQVYAALARVGARRVLSVGDGAVLDGFGDQVAPLVRGAAQGESTARGLALAWELATGAAAAAVTSLDARPARALLADVIAMSVAPESAMVAAFREALGWEVRDGGQLSTWKGWRTAAIATTAARAAMLASPLMATFDGLPGEPCPGCGAAIADADPGPVYISAPTGGDYDWAERHNIDLVCSGCGAQYRSTVNKRCWVEDGRIEYLRS